ncbi:UDP-glucosyltransferase 2-like [Phymastichus coffea]|uniref:UDP-glucosyltransferase 2-like n=1 Tax=Phymastichus coffea TaxID=108790 RepID=UPI00273B7E18|nr:UDP-glucosyltransferase 2-like [Phymastichus coffea]
MVAMKLVLIYFTLCTMTLCSFGDGYRILGVFPYSAKSQNIVFEALMKGLAKRGHQVDVISHYPQTEPVKNYNVIINLEGSMENTMNNFTFQYIANINNDIIANIADFYGNRLCQFLGSEQIQTLIKNPPKDPPYNLIIIGAFGAHCYFGLGYVFNVPVVAISSSMEYPWVSHFIGNDENLAYVHNTFHIGIGRMSFIERLKNVISNYIAVRRFHKLTEKIQTDAMRTYLRPNIPNIREVERNIALTLVNSHHVLFGVKPIVPSLIQIGGLHVEAGNETLPAELKKWMDESSSGIVYFSFGSMILIETFPANQLREIFASIEKMSPVRVLIKIFNSTMLSQSIPSNVKIMPWMPQQAVLAHPNTKVFVTHGGLGGTQEALYYGVPMIGIPLFGDQFRNVQSFVEKQMGVKIDYKQLNGKTMGAALTALLHNPTYQEKAKYYSKLFRDNPIRPMDKAAFWIEYVIRNGANVLKSPALELSFLQLSLLDVYLTILFFIIITTFVLCWNLKMILQFLIRKYRHVAPANIVKKRE